MENQKGNAGWLVLGLFFPLIGLILYLVWKNDRPGDSKMAGKGALIGVIIEAVIMIIYFIIAFIILGSAFAFAGSTTAILL